jgi:hypothetical protein
MNFSPCDVPRTFTIHQETFVNYKVSLKETEIKFNTGRNKVKMSEILGKLIYVANFSIRSVLQLLAQEKN